MKNYRRRNIQRLVEGIAYRLKARVYSDTERIEQIEDEQKEIFPYYLRFLDLEREARDKRERLRRAMALLNGREQYLKIRSVPMASESSSTSEQTRTE